MTLIGNMYRDGHGGAKNLKTAITWWKKVADLGDSSAKDNLKKYTSGNKKAP